MLELNNLSAGYGTRRVLDGVSVGFEKGRLTCIVGVNGCGQSTLLKTALGLLSPMSGEIFLDGALLSDMKRNQVDLRISYLAQGKATPDMTVEQMVLHGRFPYLSYPRRYTSHDREIARASMERMGIADHAEEPLVALSGGMRQNAYLAMALAQDTDYILLDEPTTYLDIGHQIALMRTLRSLAEEGKGIVAVMHDLPLAFSFSDTVAVMDGGRILWHGAPRELCGTDLIPRVFGVSVGYENGEYRYRMLGEG